MYAMVGPKRNSEKSAREERPLKCGICHKHFNFQSDLKRHSQVHSGFKPHCCSYCSKRFLKSSDLKRHVRTHTGEKPYPCLICGRPFANSYDLTKHTRVHTGEKPYSCPQCGRRFANTSNLRIHQRAHTGEKPYRCEQCNKKFSYASGLRDHKKTHHIVTDSVTYKDANDSESQVNAASEELAKTSTSKSCKNQPKAEGNNAGVYRSESYPGPKSSNIEVTVPRRRHSDPVDSREKPVSEISYLNSNNQQFTFDSSDQRQSLASNRNSIPDFRCRSATTDQNQRTSCLGDVQSAGNYVTKLEALLKGESISNSLHPTPTRDPYKETRAQLNSGVRLNVTCLLSDRTLEQAPVAIGHQGDGQIITTRLISSPNDLNFMTDRRSNSSVEEVECDTEMTLNNNTSHTPFAHAVSQSGDPCNNSHVGNVDPKAFPCKYSTVTQCIRNDQRRYPLKKRTTSFQSEFGASNRAAEPLDVRRVDTVDHFNLDSASNCMVASQSVMATSPSEIDNLEAYKHSYGTSIAETHENQYVTHLHENPLRFREPKYHHTGALSPSCTHTNQRQIQGFPPAQNTPLSSILPNSESSSSPTAKNGVLKAANGARYVVPISSEVQTNIPLSNQTSEEIRNGERNEAVDIGTALYTPISSRNVYYTHYAQGPPPLLAFTQHTTSQFVLAKNKGQERPKLENSEMVALDTPLDLTISKSSQENDEQKRVSYSDPEAYWQETPAQYKLELRESHIGSRNTECAVGGKYAIHTRPTAPFKRMRVTQMIDQVIRNELLA